MFDRMGSSTRVRRQALGAALVALATASGPAMAGGMMVYELGTADVGLASAGYGARAQDASTVFTNPAGMTRLEGNQILGAGQMLWSNTRFSIDSGTSPLLGSNDGGYPVGKDGFFPGGGGFASFTVAPNVKAGFALAGNFGGALNYDNDWVGRYYVQQTWIVGLSLLPSIAWKVNDKLSLGASLNAMYGIYKNNLAINNVNPFFGDGRLKTKDETWGWGANLGMLYEFTPGTRFGLTWNSQVNLDFNAPLEFAGLAPGISAALSRAGLLDASLRIGIKVPQQAMASLYTQLDDRWALLGSVGWQQWSKFGQIQVGIGDTLNPTSSITTSIPFKDTWHVAGGAQYRLNGPWLLNFGIAYDSAFQENSDKISPLLPNNAAWRFGVGGQQQLSKASYWGLSAEYLYGGTLKTDIRDKPVIEGGKGDLVGTYGSTGILFFGAYYSRTF